MQKHPRSWILAALIALPVTGFSKQPLPDPSAKSLKLEACRLEHPDRVQSVGARCGFLDVAENPALPAGRKIRLRIAVVSAVNHEGARDPVFILAGGPGQSATEFYATLAGAFGRVQRERDIVLVDQRGTGQSNVLNCKFPDEDEAAQMSREQMQALSRACLDSLKADVAQYTTSVAVRDLEQVRLALGYGAINLYGISYGTRVAQHYLRRYPSQVRSMILDGVVPPQRILGIDSAIYAQRALEMIFERCRKDVSCHEAFADPKVDFETLKQQLTRAPAQVSFPDPVKGTMRHETIRLVDFQLAMRLMSYAPEQAAILPLLLYQGAQQGNLAPLTAQSRMLAEQIDDALSIGMHNAVVCTEDAPFFKTVSIDKKALENSYLGTSQADMLEHMCSVWPRGVLDDDFHAPLNSQTPALLLSGSADPVTPPIYAEEALKGLHKGIHVILEGQGHGQLARGCVPILMGKFLNQGTTEKLDVSCTREVSPAPFFTSFSGPTP